MEEPKYEEKQATNLDRILHLRLLLTPLPTRTPKTNLLHQRPRLPTQPPQPLTIITTTTLPIRDQKLPLLIHHPPPIPTTNPHPLRAPLPPSNLHPPLSLPLPPPDRLQNPLALLPPPPKLLPLPPQRRLHHPLRLAGHAGARRVERGLELRALVGAQPGEGGAD